MTPARSTVLRPTLAWLPTTTHEQRDGLMIAELALSWLGHWRA